MRILLTGARGQIGTEIRRRAQARALLAPDRSEFDLSKPESLRPWLDRTSPELILNVGAYTAVDKAEDEPDLAFRVNRDSVAVLAKYANENGVPLLQLSTDYVFDGSSITPYAESDETQPIGVYGASKLAGENAARTAAQHLILRVSWVFAAHGSNFVRTMLRLGSERDELRVVEDQRGGPTWAGHIAQCLMTLIDRIEKGERLPNGTWHYAGTPHVTWRDFAVEILNGAMAHRILTKVPRVEGISTAEYPTRARRPANSRMDCSLVQQQLGLPAPDWREGLEAMLTEIAASR